MGLKVFWTEFAKVELQEIYQFHLIKVNRKVAESIASQITQSVKILANQPKTGQREDFLINRPEEFRYIISTHYKVIYWVNTNKNQVEITDVFDTRQNPAKIQRFK